MNVYVMKKILAIPEESINVNRPYKLALYVNSIVKLLFTNNILCRFFFIFF